MTFTFCYTNEPIPGRTQELLDEHYGPVQEALKLVPGAEWTTLEVDGELLGVTWRVRFADRQAYLAAIRDPRWWAVVDLMQRQFRLPKNFVWPELEPCAAS